MRRVGLGLSPRRSPASRRWVERRRTACESHNDPGSLSDKEYDQIVECLEIQLSSLKRRISGFKEGDVNAFGSVMTALDDC